MENNEIARSAELFVEARFFRYELTAVYWGVMCQSLCCKTEVSNVDQQSCEVLNPQISLEG